LRLLVDTHILLWGLEDPRKLTTIEVAAMGSPDNDVYFSPVNIWEIAIKVGKRQMSVGPNFLERIRRQPGLKLLPIKVEHVWGVRDLPAVHGDPFDRLLSSQAIFEGLTLVTRDGEMSRYGVKRLAAD
jgi:PIN domain nuclease of toxin-antitoxin system